MLIKALYLHLFSDYLSVNFTQTHTFKCIWNEGVPQIQNLTSETLYYNSKFHSGLATAPSLRISVNMIIRKTLFMKKYYDSIFLFSAITLFNLTEKANVLNYFSFNSFQISVYSYSSHLYKRYFSNWIILKFENTCSIFSMIYIITLSQV